MTDMELITLMEKGVFKTIGLNLSGALLVNLTQDLDAVALICLHAIASSYAGHDIPDAVSRAYRLADAYMKRRLEGPPAPTEESNG